MVGVYFMMNDYINYRKVENLKHVSKLMTIIILGAIFIIYFYNLYLTGDFSTQTIQVIFNISVPCVVAVIVCHLGDRISNKWKYLVGVYLIVALYVNFFQVHYFDDPLHLWAVSYCAVPIIGQIMTVFNVIESFLVLTKKYLKVLDLICLLDFIIGVGGVVYFVYTGSFIYTVHYLLSHIPFAFMFLFMYPDEGLTDIFCYDSVLSNSLLVLFAAISLIVPLLTIVAFTVLKAFVYVSLFSLYTIVCCTILIIVWLFTLLYARRLNEDDVESKNDLKNLNEAMHDVQIATNTAVFYSDENGEYYWSPEVYTILEREPRDDDKNKGIFAELMSKEDQKKLVNIYENLAPNEFLGDTVFKITLENGKVKYINANIHKLYDKKGNFIRTNCYAQDITYEHNLLEDDEEKTILVKEVHHRVKNNLQVLSSFISLEKKFYGDDPDKIIDITRSRIESLALLHETIYNEKHMDYITIKDFFEEFDEKLRPLSAYTDIQFINDIDDITLPIDSVTPLMLMINELSTNSFKYAFKDNSEKIITKSIKLIDSGKICRIHYKDNGPGIPEGFDMDSSPSLGWTIIKSLTSQLDGEFEIYNDNGFNFVLEFPVIG